MTQEEKKKYNGDLLIYLFYYFYMRCLNITGKMSDFKKELKGAINPQNGKPISRQIISNFLNTLEIHQVFDLRYFNRKSYKINRTNLKLARLSYEQIKMVNTMEEMDKLVSVDRY